MVRKSYHGGFCDLQLIWSHFTATAQLDNGKSRIENSENFEKKKIENHENSKSQPSILGPPLGHYEWKLGVLERFFTAKHFRSPRLGQILNFEFSYFSYPNYRSSLILDVLVRCELVTTEKRPN